MGIPKVIRDPHGMVSFRQVLRLSSNSWEWFGEPG